MKASELIKRLNELIDDYGDREVTVEGVGDPVTEVDYEFGENFEHFIVNDFEKG